MTPVDTVLAHPLVVAAKDSVASHPMTKDEVWALIAFLTVAIVILIGVFSLGRQWGKMVGGKENYLSYQRFKCTMTKHLTTITPIEMWEKTKKEFICVRCGATWSNAPSKQSREES